MIDDGVGIEAIRLFRETYDLPPGVDLLDGGTLGLDLLPRMEGYGGILIVDCVTAGHPPGTLLRVEGEDVAATFANCLSAHQMGLKDLISVLELQGRLPARLTVLGVEPEDLDVGEFLSEPVRRTLPRLVAAMAEVLAEWGHSPRPFAA